MGCLSLVRVVKNDRISGWGHFGRRRGALSTDTKPISSPGAPNSTRSSRPRAHHSNAVGTAQLTEAAVVRVKHAQMIQEYLQELGAALADVATVGALLKNLPKMLSNKAPAEDVIAVDADYESAKSAGHALNTLRSSDPDDQSITGELGGIGDGAVPTGHGGDRARPR